MDKITSRAVIGIFKRILEQNTGVAWVNAVSSYFTSDQASEDYAWIGAPPAMQEWLGQRKAKGLPEYDFSIKNKRFEATLEFLLADMRRDKIGTITSRIMEMVERGQTHWAKLLSELIVNGESTLCYDGQYFFDTDHSEGDSGTQSNDIEVDISALPVGVNGTTTLPSVPEMQLAIARGIQQITTFVDDQGEPMNETAKEFLVKVPPSMMQVAFQAVATPLQVAESQTGLSELQQDFTIRPVVNPRLSTWTDKFAIFRTDAPIKALIRQEEKVIDLKAKAEGSDFEFDNDAHQYGIDSSRNVGYGRWQNACLVKLV